MDGFYILRTSLTETDIPIGDVVRAYKNLEQAERAFGSIKGPDLQIRPIHHRLEDRVRAHVLICMLAYYLTWHLKAAWKPLLFTDEHRPSSPDPVSKAVRSPAAQQQSTDETDQHRAARPQLPHPPERARDPDPEHHAAARPQQHLRETHPADRRCKPKRSISPNTPPSSPFGRHDPNTPNHPKPQGIRRIRLPHQGELRASATPARVTCARYPVAAAATVNQTVLPTAARCSTPHASDSRLTI